jgi:hypothetical protein
LGFRLAREHLPDDLAQKNLILREVGQVFVAILVPDPRNSGAGIRMLQQAGIDVSVEETMRPLADCRDRQLRSSEIANFPKNEYWR